MSHCARCGEHNIDGASFCSNCGTPTAAPGAPEVSGSQYVAPPTAGETGPPIPPTAGVPPAPTSQMPRIDDGTTVPNAMPPVAAGSGTNRSASLMAAALVVAIVVIVGGIFILLAADSDETAGDDALVGVDTTDVSTTTPATSVAPTTTAAPATTAAAAPVATVAAPTVPATPAAAPPPPASTIAPPPPSMTLAPPPPTVPVAPARAPGDLGLAQPILDEACDGRYITFVGSAVGATPYADAVTSLLNEYPGTNYIWTRSCPSLRQSFSDGSEIYGVVFGPYLSLEQACAARASGPSDAYVKRISTFDPPEHEIDC